MVKPFWVFRSLGIHIKNVADFFRKLKQGAMGDTLSLVSVTYKALAAFLPIYLNTGGTEGDRMSGTDGYTRFALSTKLCSKNRAHQ